MADYNIKWKRTALKEIEKIDKRFVSKVINAVEVLKSNPCPANSKKLIGFNNTHRLRVGDYRIIYNVIMDTVVIEIVHVKHRKDIYRNI